jgi:hypothetical protein
MQKTHSESELIKQRPLIRFNILDDHPVPVVMLARTTPENLAEATKVSVEVALRTFSN